MQQEAEENEKLQHLQEEADAQHLQVAAAQKNAMSARTSLLVLQEKYDAAQSALKALQSDLCTVLLHPSPYACQGLETLRQGPCGEHTRCNETQGWSVNSARVPGAMCMHVHSTC